MSPLLAVAIVLLVLVVGLTLLQRRGQTDTHRPRRGPMPPAPPPAPDVPELADPPASEPPSATDVRSDPVVGTIGYFDGIWMTENDLNLHGAQVMVEITGTVAGPTNEDHEIVKAALARPDLDERARPLVAAELERRGEELIGLVPYSMAVRPDEHGVRHGYLWYDTASFLGEIGVKSADHWRTITIAVEE